MIRVSLLKQNSVGALFLDFTDAFGSINRTKLGGSKMARWSTTGRVTYEMIPVVGYKQWCHKYTVCMYKYKYSETLRVQVQVLAKFTSTSTSTEFQVPVWVQVLVLPSKVYSNSSKWLALLLICFIL